LNGIVWGSKKQRLFLLLHKPNDAVDANFVEELPEVMLEFNLAFFS
jgi:hypothetical protein